MKFLFFFAFVLIQLFTTLSAPVNTSTTEDIISKRTYVPPDMIYYYIYFIKPENWDNEIYTYVYTEEEELKNSEAIKNWPGVQAFRLGESNNYYISYPQHLLGHSQIIFTDGKNQSPSAMQNGFDLVKEAVYTSDGIAGIFDDYDNDNNYEITYGNEALIYYHPTYGYSKSNNSKMYVHYKSTTGEWKDVEMSLNPYTSYFTTKIDMGDAEDITFCFTDGNGTWDNNNGNNYNFKKFENIYINSNVKFY